MPDHGTSRGTAILDYHDLGVYLIHQIIKPTVHSSTLETVQASVCLGGISLPQPVVSLDVLWEQLKEGGNAWA